MQFVLKLFVGTALVSTMTAVPSLASERDEARAERAERFAVRMIERMDQAGDGVVSLEEFVAAHMERFRAADTAGDGTVTRAELEAHLARRAEAMTARMVERLDTAGDGRISLEEARAAGRGLERRFSRLDADGDGYVTAEELAAAHERMGGRMAERMMRRLGGADERISLAEVEERARQRFERLDANGDGVLDAAELGEAAKRWGEHRHRGRDRRS